ncbi:hypothetical protein SESBI_20436 [Sesbania bispinosa]|nr:hypothetical protein SESBI_20436 [Sesbania bispinosa]
MVKAFYAASKVKTFEDGSPWIRSCLKGVDMKLNQTILCLVTDLKDHGSRLYDKVKWMEKIIASEEEVGRILFSNGRISTKSKNLNNISKLLFNFISRSILPRGGSFEKVTTP